MLRKNDFLTFLVISVVIHSVLVFYPIFAKNKPVFVSAPVDVTFYPPAQRSAEPPPAVQQKEEVKPEPVPKEEIKKEEPIKKEDIVVKAKEKPKPKPKQKPQPKKTPKKEEEVKEPQPVVQPQVETVQAPPSEQRYAAVGGPQFENVSFDAQNFKFAYYTNLIIKKIGKEWRWADTYGKLRALVYFKIHRDGTATDIAVKESSGNDEYDKYALDTAQRASPFPPLPESYSGDSLGVYFEFKYRN